MFIIWLDPKEELSTRNHKFSDIIHGRTFAQLLPLTTLEFLLKLYFLLKIHGSPCQQQEWNFQNKVQFFLIVTYLRKERRKVSYCSKEYGLTTQIAYSQSLIDSSASKLSFSKQLINFRKHSTKTIVKSSYEPNNIAIHFNWWLKILIRS